MRFTFDLISDLHVDTWPETFNWVGLATSPYCVVAGDVARDRRLLIDTLRHLGRCYQGVFYIDGNDEHRDHYYNIANSYESLNSKINSIPNVVYLQDNVVILDGIAIMGTNGWWDYELDPTIDSDEVMTWFEQENSIDRDISLVTKKLAVADSMYIAKSIKRLQTHLDVEKIVMVTHTVPCAELISHDIHLSNTIRFNTMGNSTMLDCLHYDLENKIDTWCFGHYHGAVDQIRNGVRFVNNCRGKNNTNWSKYVYHPRRIEIEY
jgi:predicted phosphohydrolase